MHYTNYTGIVLRRQALREADEIVTLWSREAGKIRVMVRGVRRETSKLKAVLAPLSQLSFQAVSKDRMPMLIGVRIVSSYADASKSLPKTAMVFTIFELILRTTGDNEPNNLITSLLEDALSELTLPGEISTTFAARFMIRLLEGLGYELDLTRCASCGDSIDPNALAWSHALSCLACGKCIGQSGDITPLDAHSAGLVAAIQQGYGQTAGRDPQVIRTVTAWLSRVLQAITERVLNSEKFFQENAAPLAGKNGA